MLWSVLLLGSLLCWPNEAWGQEPCSVDRPEGCVYLGLGQTAPFMGMLLSIPRAAELTVKTEQCQERIELGVAEAKEKGQIRRQAEKDRRKGDRDAHEASMAAMRAGMRAYEAKFSPHWYHAPELWFAIGVLTAVGVIALSVWVVSETRPLVVQSP